MHAGKWGVGAAIALAGSLAQALEPSQIFDKVSSSVWVIYSYEGKDRATSLGSAVVIGTGRLITNCHVVEKARVVLLRRENVMYEAKIEHADAARDLCLIKVANFTAPAVEQRSVKDLKVGERVYAIGNPRGLEVTLSEGLVSGLRTRSDEPDVDTLIQTSAPISAGSSGGGLFDTEGRLVGITTFQFRNSQNLNVALPTDWIAQITERAQAALAKRESRTARGAGVSNAAPGLPAPGTTWAYNYVERIFSRRPVEVNVRVVSVDDTIVEEAVTASGANSVRRTVNASETRFMEFPLNASNALVELAPYLVALSRGDAPAPKHSPEGYPRGGSSMPGWNVSVRAAGWEHVKVPAGTYRALRYEVLGNRTLANSGRTVAAGRFEMSIWYSNDVDRVVKQEHRVWTADSISPMLAVDELLELVAYRPPN